MEKIVCLIAGLPGSGKSKYLEHLHSSGFLTINNPNDFDTDVLPYLNEPEQVVAIADFNLCFSSSREKSVVKIRSIVPDVIFRWIYFENDPIQCISNLRAAGLSFGDETRENLVWNLSQGYSIPANIETKPVVHLDNTANVPRISHVPGNSAGRTFKLVRVVDDLVIFSSPEWEKFQQTARFILQKYPTHHYMIVEEVITREVREIVFDRLSH